MVNGGSMNSFDPYRPLPSDSASSGGFFFSSHAPVSAAGTITHTHTLIYIYIQELLSQQPSFSVAAGWGELV